MANWDAFVEQHFLTWLAHAVPSEERVAVEIAIRELVMEDDSVLLNHTWPELRRYAGV